MLPEGITIEHALAGACKMARRIAPRWLHCDEADSAAGIGLMRALETFDGGDRGRWWNWLYVCVRGPVRNARRDWLTHGVVKTKGPGLASHGWEADMGEPCHEPNLAAGMEAEETLATLEPDARKILELMGMGHRPAEVASMLGLMPGSVHTYASRARRQLRGMA